MDLPVVVRKTDDGAYGVDIPVLSGCVAVGKTLEEALARMRQAAELVSQQADEESWFNREVDGENTQPGDEVEVEDEAGLT